MTSDATTAAGRTITVTRTFDAPRDLVFKAWTDPNMLAQWWGPEGFTTRVPEFDLRPGGMIRMVMSDAEGNDYPMKLEVREVAPPERLVMIDSFDDGRPERPGLATVTFVEQDGKTTLTVSTLYETTEDRDTVAAMGMEEGFQSSFNRLDALLASLR